MAFSHTLGWKHVLVGALVFCSAPTAWADIDLRQWAITLPVDDDNSGNADMIKEDRLANGFEYPPYFSHSEHGDLVFVAPVKGSKTPNTTYTRSELRSMLRCGNKSIKTQGISLNNWVFSSAPIAEQQASGAVDGILNARLMVNHVTTTGDKSQIGRVIIGQIHATKHEPIRVYYRKLPKHQRGSIYLAHETASGATSWFNVVGGRANSTPEPIDGIALNQEFGYQIAARGNQIVFTLKRDGHPDIMQVIDMSKSGYDQGEQYLYFKAGVYNQNKTGAADDYVKATFSQLETLYPTRRYANSCD